MLADVVQKTPFGLCFYAKRFALGLLGGPMISLVTSLVIWPAGLSAAPLDQTPDLRGAPISQQFLANGASIVTTLDSRACVVSRRIGIEASIYLATDGTVVPFDQIRRSIAASVQAVSGADERQAEIGRAHV